MTLKNYELQPLLLKNLRLVILELVSWIESTWSLQNVPSLSGKLQITIDYCKQHQPTQSHHQSQLSLCLCQPSSLPCLLLFIYSIQICRISTLCPTQLYVIALHPSSVAALTRAAVISTSISWSLYLWSNKGCEMWNHVDAFFVHDPIPSP